VTIRAGYFSGTTKHAVTDEADGLTVQGANESRHAFLVQSDVTVHLTRDGTDASAENGLRVPAGAIILINTVAGDEISFVTGDGESDGSIWLTEVDH
jgi:hypothetical protein